MPLRLITAAELEGRGNVGKPDTPGVSAREMQRILDEIPREIIIPRYNETISMLSGSEGASLIGSGEGNIQQELDRLDSGKVSTEAHDSLSGRVGKLEENSAGRDVVEALAERTTTLESIKADRSEVLSKSNSSEYTPREPFNPATKQYVDETVIAISAGDMAKATYDADRDGVVDRAADADRLEGHPASYFAEASYVEGELRRIDAGVLGNTGGEVTGTLVLSKSNDASPTSYNSPALVVGGKPAEKHIEVDGNEILAKSNETTPAPLCLSAAGGGVVLAGGLKVTDGGANITNGLIVDGVNVGTGLANVTATADKANTLASAAMPKSGGTFTGNVAASTGNHSGWLLYNSLVQNSGTATVSTRGLLFRRK